MPEKTLNRRKIRGNHDVLVACQELGRYLYPYPIEGGGVARFQQICQDAGIQCEGEDLTLSNSMILYAYLMGEVDAIFSEISALCEQKVRHF